MSNWLMLLGAIVFILYKNRINLRKVSKRSQLIVSAVFILLIFSAGLILYYPGRWLATLIHNSILKTTFQFVVIIVVLGMTSQVWEFVLRRVKRQSGIE